MSQARLKSLKVKGLRSFASESDIEFPESGLTLFRGKNLDTGGSSGSGKSSLLLAITYLFGFCRFAATSLQSWLTEDGLEVEGVITKGSDELVITRGQKLSLTLNGKRVAGSAKALEDQITKFVGLPPELLAALTYRGQKQPGLFLSKTDSEKKEFLTILLDLLKFESAVEASQVKAKVIEQELQGISYHATEVEKRLKGYEDSFKGPQVADETLTQKQLQEALKAQDDGRRHLTELRARVKTSEAEIEKRALQYRREAEPVITALQDKVAALQKEQPDTSSVDNSKLLQLGSDLTAAQGFLEDELRADQARHRQQRQEADSVHTKLILVEKRLGTVPALLQLKKQIEEEIQKYERDICDRCERPWDQAKDRKVLAQKDLAETVDEIQAVTEVQKDIEPLQKQYRALGEFVPAPAVQELRDIVTALASQQAEEQGRIWGEIKLLRSEQDKRISDTQAELQEIRLGLGSTIDRFRADATEKIQYLHEQLENLEREQNMIEAHVRGVQASLSRIQIDNARETERVAHSQKIIGDLRLELGIHRQKLELVTANYNAELDFQKLIGREGFLGAIFDEVLWEISEETNRLLAQFPNTAHVTLHFRSESLSQKGTIKKAITPVVTIGGFEAPLASGLSGGMETAVELAVDLAVAQVVSRRTGAMPGWLILDESFTGLGPVEAEASMEILRAFAEDKLVLVVDHSSEFKSMFKRFIDVEYQAGYSRARNTNV